MDFKVNTAQITHRNFTVNALNLVPEGDILPYRAVFCHGYTSSKHSILAWGSRCADFGIPTTLFDLPGHYLGSYNEVSDPQVFKDEAPDLFLKAYESLLNENSKLSEEHTILIGGHSLGALMSIKALEKNLFQKETISILVGFGLGPENATHAFDTDFYKKAFEFREQLVSPAIRGEALLGWIKEQKLSLKLTGKKIHLITGKDDVVVGENGSENLEKLLSDLGNKVSLERPNKMSHHMPDLAAPHIMAFLRKLIKN